MAFMIHDAMTITWPDPTDRSVAELVVETCQPLFVNNVHEGSILEVAGQKYIVDVVAHTDDMLRIRIHGLQLEDDDE